MTVQMSQPGVYMSFLFNLRICFVTKQSQFVFKKCRHRHCLNLICNSAGPLVIDCHFVLLFKAGPQHLYL